MADVTEEEQEERLFNSVETFTNATCDSEGDLKVHPDAFVEYGRYVIFLIFQLACDCKDLYDWRSEIVAWAVCQLAYHPRAFVDAFTLFLHLIDKHCHNRTIVGPIPQCARVLDDCEFCMLFMIAKRWKVIFTDPKKDQNDPGRLLTELFDKYRAPALLWARFRFLLRLERFLIKRKAAWVKASLIIKYGQDVPAKSPPELLRKLQDSMYDGAAVSWMLREVYLHGDAYEFGEHQETGWLEETFNDAGL